MGIGKPIAIAASVLVLAACGGGGGSTSNRDAPLSSSELDRLRALTGAAEPAETAADQSARAAEIFSRTDSLIVSTMRGETNHRELPNLTLQAACSGITCTFIERNSGISVSINLDDLEFTSIPGQEIGTKHGITLFRGAGRFESTGTYASVLGAWMNHSAFAVQTEMGTVENISFDGRLGYAGGDLTGSPPTEDATWRGFMVGTPATGAGRGDRLQGDAELTYRLDTQMLDASFTNIQNVDELRAHSVSTVRFTSVPVSASGEFLAGATGNRIQGGFYGPGQAEATGIFEQMNIVGAFGTKLQ